MKLKTKFEDEDFRLGEVCEASITTARGGVIKVEAPANDGGWNEFHYKSLKDMLDKWEDYEEPKVFWYIDDFMVMCGTEGEFTDPDLASFTKKDIEKLKKIGNYFETKEDAEKAVEKLKAWKRLKDKGFRFKSDFLDINTHNIRFKIDYQYDMTDETSRDLHMIFRGEE